MEGTFQIKNSGASSTSSLPRASWIWIIQLLLSPIMLQESKQWRPRWRLRSKQWKAKPERIKTVETRIKVVHLQKTAQFHTRMTWESPAHRAIVVWIQKLGAFFQNWKARRVSFKIEKAGIKKSRNPIFLNLILRLDLLEGSFYHDPMTTSKLFSSTAGKQANHAKKHLVL